MSISRRISPFLTLGTLALTVISLPNSVAAEVPASRVEAQIHQALAEIEQSEMSVVVSYSIGDAPPVTMEFGRFRDDGIPAARTQVDLLSITKSLTAISILKLVDQGRLTLSDTIDLYLTGVPDDKKAITIHQLLTHSSGLSGGCGRSIAHSTCRCRLNRGPLMTIQTSGIRY